MNLNLTLELSKHIFLQILSKNSKWQNLPNIFLNSQSHEHLNKNHSTALNLKNRPIFCDHMSFFHILQMSVRLQLILLRNYFVYHENRRLINKNRQKFRENAKCANKELFLCLKKSSWWFWVKLNFHYKKIWLNLLFDEFESDFIWIS